MQARKHGPLGSRDIERLSEREPVNKSQERRGIKTGKGIMKRGECARSRRQGRIRELRRRGEERERERGGEVEEA